MASDHNEPRRALGDKKRPGGRWSAYPGETMWEPVAAANLVGHDQPRLTKIAFAWRA